MNRYPVDKFPQEVLAPEVVARHEKHIESLSQNIEGYAKVGHRDQSMYDWLLRIFENLGLSTVENQYLDSLSVVKTKLAMFVVLIDDTVDNAEKRDFSLFEEISKIPFTSEPNLSKLNKHAIEYLNFTKSLWDEIISDIKIYPNFDEYKDAFYFDLKQLINSMEYSRFANSHPNAANLVENDAYVHHSMIVLIQIDLDLMCSRGFDSHELGTLREIAYISQRMAKIGNLIGTYPRELLESDMSSEALVRFRKDFGNDFNYKLNKLFNREHRYPKFEEKLILEWEKEDEAAKKLAKRIKSIDMERFMKERDFIQRAYRIKADYW